MKKIIITVLAVLMLTTAAFASNEVTVTEAGNFHIYYNDVEKGFADVNGTIVRPIVYEGTTYLPVRAASELIGLSASWDGETSTITLTSGTGSGCVTTPPASIAQQPVTATVADNFTILYNSTKQTFTDANGKTVYPLVKAGTTYLPIRALCNMLNIAVEWEGITSSIYLGTHTAAPTVTPSVGSKPAVMKDLGLEGGKYPAYEVNTEGYPFIRITNSEEHGRVYVYDGPSGTERTSLGGVNGYEGAVEVSGYSKVWIALCHGTITSITLENAAVVPSYSIPSGATALTDANTHFSTTDTTYSNGQFIRHNRAPLSHGAGDIKFQNSGYTTLTFTVTTYATPMHVVAYDDPVVLSVVQASNTTKTYTVDISSLQTVNFRTFNFRNCDSVITNAYVK